VPASEYAWLAAAPSPVAPSPNSQWYGYRPPAPPDAIAANEIASPSTADVVASVAIAVTSEIVTGRAMVDGAAPASAPWTVTTAETVASSPPASVTVHVAVFAADDP